MGTRGAALRRRLSSRFGLDGRRFGDGVLEGQGRAKKKFATDYAAPNDLAPSLLCRWNFVPAVRVHRDAPVARLNNKGVAHAIYRCAGIPGGRGVFRIRFSACQLTTTGGDLLD